VQFRAVVDFQFVCLPQKRGVVVALLLLARGVLFLFALALGFALCGAGRREEAVDGVHEADEAGARLFLFAPEVFGFVPVDGVEPVKFLAGFAVERLAELVHFGRLGFDEPAALLGLALGDGFSESLGRLIAS